jgi:hypothetical protein
VGRGVDCMRATFSMRFRLRRKLTRRCRKRQRGM